MTKPLSLHDFKNWLSEQEDLTNFFNIGADREEQTSPKFQKYIGRQVESRVSLKKLLQRVETEDDPESVVNEFLQSGGVVSDVSGKNVIVETESGDVFSVPRFCVGPKKEPTQ
jgi:hypothetical protein